MSHTTKEIVHRLYKEMRPLLAKDIRGVAGESSQTGHIHSGDDGSSRIRMYNLFDLDRPPSDGDTAYYDAGSTEWKSTNTFKIIPDDDSVEFFRGEDGPFALKIKSYENDSSGIVSTIHHYGRHDGDGEQEYARQHVIITAADEAGEYGEFQWQMVVDGAFPSNLNQMRLTGGKSIATDLYLQSEMGSDTNEFATIQFWARDSQPANEQYAAITAKIIDNTTTTEDGALLLQVVSGGTVTTVVDIQPTQLTLEGIQIIDHTSTEAFLVRKNSDGGDVFTIDTTNSEMLHEGSAIFNEAGADFDFRIEGSGAANAFFVQGSDGFVGMGNAAPQRQQHISVAASGSRTLLALDNTDSTDNNAAVVSFRSTTTGAGATAFTEFAGIKGKFTTHDHATRAGEFIMFTTVGGVTADRLIMGSDITLTPVDGIIISLGNDAGDDFAIDTNSFVVEGDSGHSGFGTAEPDQLVHLSANIDATLRIESTDTTIQVGQEYGVIEFETRDNSNPGVGARIVAVATSTAARMELAFETGIGGSSSEAVRIDYVGKLLVGLTTSPLGKTHIDQASASGSIPVLFLDQGDVSEQIIKASYSGADVDMTIIELDVDGAPKFGWSETPDIFTLNKGLAAGDGGTTNYANFAGDGELTLFGTARVMRCFHFEPSITRLPGANPPASDEIDNFEFHRYDRGTEESSYIHWEIPHNYAAAGTVHLHFEFLVENPPVGDDEAVVMGVEYKKLSEGDVFDFDAGTASGTVTETIVDGETAYITHMTGEISLTTTGWVPMDVILFRFYRDATNVADTYDNEGAPADNDVWVYSYHLEWLSDKLGTAT